MPFRKSTVPELRVLKGFFNLKNNIMKPEQLIGKKVRGFKFESKNTVVYDEIMDEYIGKIGDVVKIYKDNTCKIQFEDDYYFYPADQIEYHLVEDETFTFNANHNKMKLEDEIPTLSDGVMMLVSDDNINFEPREVYGKKDNLFFVWGLSQEPKSFSYKYAKPIEPTKEEQLTAILGSSEKVSEIMELFKN